MPSRSSLVRGCFSLLTLTALGCSSSSNKAGNSAGAPGSSGAASGGSPAAGGGAGSTSSAGSAGTTSGAGAGGSVGSAGANASAGAAGQTTMMPPAGGYTAIQMYQTSRAAGAGNKAEHCDTVTAPALKAGAATATRTTIAIDATKPRQTITGFGAALTEVTASTIAVLPADKQTEIYNAYFSSAGSAYNLTRTHIGSCDFALAPYTYDDGAADPTLANFKIDHDNTYLIPGLKKALATNPALKILASLWSAPAWMKSPAATAGGLGSTTMPTLYGGSILPADYDAFAKYLSKYVQAYKAAGLDIWALTPTNEPLGVGGSRESMVWTADTMDTFLRTNLGPQFKTDNLSTKLFVFDHNKDVPTSEMITWTQKFFGAATPNAQIAGTAVHWYNSTFNVFETSLDALHAIDPTKDILFDEGTADGFIFNKAVVKVADAAWWQNDDWYWKKDNYDWGYDYADKAIHPAYQTAHRYARDIIVGLNHWYTGWIDWNAVLNKFGALDAADGGVGAVGAPGVSHIANGVPAGIMIDEATPATPVIYYTPIFYVMRQFSKFIQPQAKILSSTVTLAADVTKLDYDNAPTQDGQALFSVAAQNPDGTLAVVLFNETGKPIDYSIGTGTQSADGTIPAQAVQTLVWK
jgi:glucosylceramidase